MLVTLAFSILGGLVTYQHDIRNNNNWVGKFDKAVYTTVITLSEPLVEKTNSWKAQATVDYIVKEGDAKRTKGNIILYFDKQADTSGISYGTQLIISKRLQPVSNTSNPGGFDYKRYALFQGITHQVYLKQKDFVLLADNKSSWYKRFLYAIQNKVLSIIRTNIRGEKEQGLAEALLIGYKNDLDKTLVQSYSNTGVVHVIAISGLHLGLIYWLLVQLLRPLKRNKKLAWISPLFIITSLWIFSLLAGAQPSVLRSAVMFTCIVLGESLSRRTSVINTLAASAFILLCINPYWLWDVGFQLSYAAVLSIVLFMKPIYNLIYTKNKILDFIWKLNAVTLAAQLLTLPISIYHFHQFPVYFLIANVIAVPLSSIIVLGEIFLCTVSFIPAIAAFSGSILQWLLRQMNNYIEYIEKLPGALLNGLQISATQAVLLIVFVSAASYWLIEKKKTGWWWSILSLLACCLLRSFLLIQANEQKKIIVYNVPGHKAIDFTENRSYFFSGDSSLEEDDFLRNFHLQPSRILNRTAPALQLPSLVKKDNLVQFAGKRILLVDSTTSFIQTPEPVAIDIVIISYNPKLYIKTLLHSIQPKQVIADASTPASKQKYWARDCALYHIPFYSIVDKGAFVMPIN